MGQRYRSSQRSQLAAPKSTQSWIIARSSTSTGKPHYVFKNKGHYECESDCIHYHTSKICSHTVAIARRNGELDGIISWHKKHHVTNATELAQSGLPMGSVGKKKAKHKGVSKKVSTKIQKLCATADESSWQLRAALQAGPSSQSQQIASPTS